MTARRPIVRAGGRDQQLPPGDTVLGVPVAMPAYQAAGTMLRLVLKANYALSVIKSDGSALTVQVIING